MRGGFSVSPEGALGFRQEQVGKINSTCGVDVDVGEIAAGLPQNYADIARSAKMLPQVPFFKA